jgi:hypothetical protein
MDRAFAGRYIGCPVQWNVVLEQGGMIEAMPERMPRISYDGHPLYSGGELCRIGFGDRLLALSRVAAMSAFVVGVRLQQLARRRRLISSNSGARLFDLGDAGVVAHRLSSSSRQAILEAAQPYFNELADARNRIPNGDRNYGDNQLNTTRSEAPILFRTIEEALEAAGLLSAVRAHLRCLAQLRKVTLQINDQWDRFWRAHFDARGLSVPETAFFHIDNTYGVVKAMIYISEVSASCGPFSYVPGTHRLKIGAAESVALRATDIWLDTHPHERRLFLALPRALRLKAKFGDDIRSGNDWGQYLLRHERVFTSAEGDVIVFDTKGVHRGGVVQQGERRVIQVMMS